jgi:hypothetical protein
MFSRSIGGSQGSMGLKCNSVSISQERAGGEVSGGWYVGRSSSAKGAAPEAGASPPGPKFADRPTGPTHEQRAAPGAKRKYS